MHIWYTERERNLPCINSYTFIINFYPLSIIIIMIFASFLHGEHVVCRCLINSSSSTTITAKIAQHKIAPSIRFRYWINSAKCEWQRVALFVFYTCTRTYYYILLVAFRFLFVLVLFYFILHVGFNDDAFMTPFFTVVIAVDGFKCRLPPGAADGGAVHDGSCGLSGTSVCHWMYALRRQPRLTDGK